MNSPAAVEVDFPSSRSRAARCLVVSGIRSMSATSRPATFSATRARVLLEERPEDRGDVEAPQRVLRRELLHPLPPGPLGLPAANGEELPLRTLRARTKRSLLDRAFEERPLAGLAHAAIGERPVAPRHLEGDLHAVRVNLALVSNMLVGGPLDEEDGHRPRRRRRVELRILERASPAHVSADDPDRGEA